ncbi:HAMP domain-containing histidine kinase [Clostridiaceae bacterium UIB06]|nr:HAMP domain-containing histidine kinase [Clostridiaceae bacterium UIB06]
MIGLSALCMYDVVKHRDYMIKEPYFHSHDFQNEVYNYCENINNFYVYYKDYNEKFGEIKATKEDMEGLKIFYQDKLKNKQAEIERVYSNYIHEAERVSDKDKANKLTDEKNKKLEEAVKENTKTDEEIKKEVAARVDKDYENIKKAIESRKDIKYYIKDARSKKVYTNLYDGTNVDEYIKNKSLYSITFPLKYAENEEFQGTNRMFRNSNLEEVRIIIPKYLDSSSYILKNYEYYNSLKSRVTKELLVGIGALIIGLLILVGVKRDTNLKLLRLEKARKIYSDMPLDLRVFIFTIYTVMMLTYLANLNFFYKPLKIDHFIKITTISIYVAYAVFKIKDVIKLWKNKKELSIQWQNSLTIKMLNISRKSSINRNIKLKIATIIGISVMLAMFVLLVPVFILHNLLIGSIISITYVVLLVRYLFKKADYLNEVLMATEKMVQGNLDCVIEEKGQGVISKIAYNINNMKTGYKKSVEQQLKSERLKAELITNVSHDLKTPLTSIINYIELLKKEDLSAEEIRGYIGVLDKKSERLKVLIEDLFEASKMSSGGVELNMEKIDVAALLKQSIAEFDEKIKKASLILKFSCDKKNVYVSLDGKKTWRVFQNLISNIVKYSQPNTRIYVDLTEEDNSVTIVMKNIAAYEMDFSVDEIFERFKRGDKSRKTEGSGLGLAIANSIVQLQGGILNIEIDGDLFKAIVIFSKCV